MPGTNSLFTIEMFNNDASKKYRYPDLNELVKPWVKQIRGKTPNLRNIAEHSILRYAGVPIENLKDCGSGPSKLDVDYFFLDVDCGDMPQEMLMKKLTDRFGENTQHIQKADRNGKKAIRIPIASVIENIDGIKESADELSRNGDYLSNYIEPQDERYLITDSHYLSNP